MRDASAGLPDSPSIQQAWTAQRVRDLGLHTTVTTAAEILGIGRSTAYDLIRRDEFPVRVLRVGTRMRVPVTALLAWLGVEA